MARIKIDMPDTYLFSTCLDVRIDDINHAAHLGHDRFIILLHEARVRFFENLGYTQLDVEGKGTVMTDLATIYRAQAFYGDVLNVEIAGGDLNRYGCDLFYRVTNKKTGQLVLEAKTGIVFFDYQANKICPIPEIFQRIDLQILRSLLL